MNNFLIDVLVKELRTCADKLEAGNSNLTETESINLLQAISHTPISKTELAEFLGVSKSTLDRKINAGLIPPGVPRNKGSHELIWYKDELYTFKLNENGNRQ